MTTVTLPNKVDVLVIGGGLAGVTALLRATELGCSALLVEKTAELGGSTVKSSGLLAFAGTEEQRRAGIEDSEELLANDIFATGRHRNDPALVAAYCAEQHHAYEWLRGHGVTFGEPHAGSGQSVPRSHGIDTVDTLRRLSAQAVTQGAIIALECPVQRLLSVDGTVCGAEVLSNGELVAVAADAVILTSGGFSRSEELLEKWAPAMRRAVREGGDGNTGDGLRMGLELGAGLADMASIKGTFGRFPWRSSAEDGAGVLVVYKGAIAVNGEGKRFIDESLPYKVIGDACLEQSEAIAFQIFDAPILALSDESVPIYSFQRRLDAGQIRVADSIAELADELGIDRDALTATVELYNTALRQGLPDEQERTTLVGGVGTPTPIDTPPFYGYPSTTTVLSTYCGLTIDAHGAVTTQDGKRIPGLFAAGEVTGGFHGDGYVTGSSLGKSVIFGHLAASASAQAVATVKEHDSHGTL